MGWRAGWYNDAKWQGNAMSVMFEVYYKPPADSTKEAALTDRVRTMGGRLGYREDAIGNHPNSICLTFDFNSYESAARAAETLRQLGEHVEGPMEYGA